MSAVARQRPRPSGHRHSVYFPYITQYAEWVGTNSFVFIGVPKGIRTHPLVQSRSIPLHESNQQVIYTDFYTNAYTKKGPKWLHR
jgi:hypothetical protein